MLNETAPFHGIRDSTTEPRETVVSFFMGITRPNIKGTVILRLGFLVDKSKTFHTISSERLLKVFNLTSHKRDGREWSPTYINLSFKYQQ